MHTQNHLLLDEDYWIGIAGAVNFTSSCDASNQGDNQNLNTNLSQCFNPNKSTKLSKGK